MKIQMLKDEYWWGGVVKLGAEMPFDEETVIDVNFAINEVDQCSPLFLSNKGRYIYSEKIFSIKFNKGVIEIESDYEVELCEGYETLKGAHLAVAKRLFKNKGIIPDEKFFEVPQYNTWIELMYNQNQEDILKYAHSIVDNGMTPGILMIDEGWSEDYGVYDFYPGRFTDPKKMIDELHELGFKVMLWVTPHISPDSNAFRELRNTDYLVKDESGEFAIRKWWNGFSCVLDLSNPDTWNWLTEKLQFVMKKYDIDGFKFDAGDSIYYRDNDQTYIKHTSFDNTTVFNKFAAEYKFNELRAVWNMGGEPLVCRLQDKWHNWTQKGINFLIPHTVLQGLLGYYYCCPDMIGGGDFGCFLDENFKFDEELYIRWLEVSVLCPMMQFSISPWRVLSKENCEIVKKYSKLHEEFAPYILELAKKAAVGEGPIVRSMEYEFPNCGYERTVDMYMLGDKYLVAPVVEKGITAKTIRLPQGSWEARDGRVYEGNQEVTIKCELPELVILKKL